MTTQKPEEASPKPIKADINTLAFELREIRSVLLATNEYRRRSANVFFFSGTLCAVILVVSSVYSNLVFEQKAGLAALKGESRPVVTESNSGLVWFLASLGFFTVGFARDNEKIRLR